MITPRTGGASPARALPAKRLLGGFQALVLGLLAPLPGALAQGTVEGAVPAARRDHLLPTPPICAELDGPLPPIVNLHDAYRLHGGSFLLGNIRDLDRFGEGMAIGDYTGDGVADLAIGEPAGAVFSNPRAGLLFPFQGSAGGPTQGRMILLGQDSAGGTPVAGDDFGAAIAVGDFNDDGFDDVAVGAPNKVSSGVAHAGRVFLFHSSDGFFLSDHGSIAQEQAGGTGMEGDEFGRALASADFNGDGFADLAVGVPGKTIGPHSDAGQVMLFPGTATGLTAGGSILTENAFGEGPADGDRFGATLLTGDFNGDGRRDLAVGIPGKKVGGADNAGVVAILYGSAQGLVAGPRLAQEQAFQSSQADDGFGTALGTGDLNDDGADDLLIGGPGKDRPGALDSGMVCAFLGAAGTFVPRPCLFEETGGVSAEGLARFGSAVAAGDLDGDGLDDVAIGAPGSAIGGAVGGALFVFASIPGDLAIRHTLVLQDAGGATDAGDMFGARVGVADFDGDGTADIAVTAPFDAPPGEPRGGSLSVFPGLSALPRLSSGPILGAVTDSSARIWGRADRAAALAVEYKPAGSAWPGSLAGPAALSDASDFTGALLVGGLAADALYDYRLLLDGVVQPGSEASFRTLETPGPGRLLRFAVGADFEFGNDPYALLPAVEARQPDLTLFVGDQIYADEPAQVDWSLKGYARRYRENWGEEFFAPFLSRHPTFNIWDDHDISDNWQEGTALPYPFARAAFDLYQASRNPPPRVAGEVAFAFDAGDASFYLLDVRSHRSLNSAPDGPSKTMLGQAVKADLKQWLLTTTARFKFLISPVMWSNHGTTGNDSWFGFQTERQEILDFIRANHVCGVVLISGDQHWSGVMRLDQAAPYSLYELSPTPLGNSTRTKTSHTGPDILFADDSSKVYGFVTADSTTEPARVTLEIYNAADVRIFQRVLTWSDLCPDSDGDTFRDDVDCAPGNASVWARPAEISVTFQENAATLQWTPTSNAGGLLAPVYDLLVSPSRSDFSATAATCLVSNSTGLSADDPQSPPIGQARYYLVRAENLCGGTLETGSNGTELLGRTCP